MDTERVKQTILENVAEIERLQAIYHAARDRAWRQNPPNGREAMEAYKSFFHASVALAFPGGYKGALARIGSGDPEAMEAAICFLELRPYFFRSGYMFKDILRKCRNAPLSPEQSRRLELYEQKLAAWQEEDRRIHPHRETPVVVAPKRKLLEK